MMKKKILGALLVVLTAVSLLQAQDIKRSLADGVINKVLSVANVPTDVTNTAAGIPFTLKRGRVEAQTAPAATVVTATPMVDTTVEVSGIVDVTLYTSGVLSCQVAWTDTGGTSRALNLQSSYAGNAFSYVFNSQNTYPLATVTIRAKANTAVTVSTTGTFSATYNAEAILKQVS